MPGHNNQQNKLFSLSQGEQLLFSDAMWSVINRVNDICPYQSGILIVYGAPRSGRTILGRTIWDYYTRNGIVAAFAALPEDLQQVRQDFTVVIIDDAHLIPGSPQGQLLLQNMLATLGPTSNQVAVLLAGGNMTSLQETIRLATAQRNGQLYSEAIRLTGFNSAESELYIQSIGKIKGAWLPLLRDVCGGYVGALQRGVKIVKGRRMRKTPNALLSSLLPEIVSLPGTEQWHEIVKGFAPAKSLTMQGMAEFIDAYLPMQARPNALSYLSLPLTLTNLGLIEPLSADPSVDPLLTEVYIVAEEFRYIYNLDWHYNNPGGLLERLLFLQRQAAQLAQCYAQEGLGHAQQHWELLRYAYQDEIQRTQQALGY